MRLMNGDTPKLTKKKKEGSELDKKRRNLDKKEVIWTKRNKMT